MSAKGKEEESALKKLADKVPVEQRSTALVLLAVLPTVPVVFALLKSETQQYILEAVYCILILVLACNMAMTGIANYKFKINKLSPKNPLIAENENRAKEAQAQIRKAATDMEGDQCNV
jgi:hypothetical protein